MDDLISRQAAIDAILAVTGNSSVRELYEHVQEHGLSDMWSGGVNAAIDIIIAVPSAQPKSANELAEKVQNAPNDDFISRKAAIAEIARWIGYIDEDMIGRIQTGLKRLPSAQPEPCEDAVSREEAKWVVFCNRDHVEDQANAIDALPPVTPKAEQPDMSEYSDKLWKAAYERGKAEAQPDLDEVYAHAETEAEARFHAEIVRCKDCAKREYCRTSTAWAVAPSDNWYCADAERRTDG